MYTNLGYSWSVSPFVLYLDINSGITRIPLSIALKNPNSFGHAKPNFSHQITPKNFLDHTFFSFKIKSQRWIAELLTCLEGLKLSKLFSKTRAVVSIVGDSLISRQETTYGLRAKETTQLGIIRWDLTWKIQCYNKIIWLCCVSNLVHPSIIKSLLDNWTKDKQTKEGFYQVVITPSGKQRGCFVLRYNFGHDTTRGAPRKDDENLIRTCSTWSWQLLQSRPPYIKTAPWSMSWSKDLFGNMV